MSDFAQSPFAGVEYYKSVVAKLGQSTVDQFVHFYVTPGASHSGAGVSSVDGATLPRGVDLLAEIDDWVDRGIAPHALVQAAQEAKPPFVVTASRPMCRYPAWPRYRGEGSPKEAGELCVRDGPVGWACAGTAGVPPALEKEAGETPAVPLTLPPRFHPVRPPHQKPSLH